jgi:hypothetical protein
MDLYDAEVAPDPDRWLALDEGERIVLVELYHRQARVPLPKLARTLHAATHVVVENQLAERDDAVTRALSRLMKQGLSRHEAIHAIGAVVAEEIYGGIHKPGITLNRCVPRTMQPSSDLRQRFGVQWVTANSAYMDASREERGTP